MLGHLLQPIKKFRRGVLPGIVTASADDDPAGISSIAAIGATLGLSQLWLVILSTPFLVAVIDMAGRIGDVTKKGLLTLIRENYGKKVSLICLLALVSANIITSIGGIIGMSAGLQLITGENYIYFIVPIIIFIWYIVIFGGYKKISKWFSWFSLIMLAFIISGFLSRPDWGEVLYSIISPKINFSLNYLAGALALFGTTLSPHIFFWEIGEEIEEKHDKKNIKQTDKCVFWGFIYGNLVNAFIIIAAAAGASGGISGEINIHNIAMSLEPLAGKFAPWLFGLGLVGGGILSIPVMAISSAYALAEYMGWPEGLNRKPARAKGFYVTITLGFIISLLALFLRIDPVKIMFNSQVLVGVLAPIVIFFVLRLSQNKRIMGEYRSGFIFSSLGWITILFLVVSEILWFCLL